MTKTPKIPYVSLFSGCGGIDLGFEYTGHFDAKLCVELEPAYYQTLVVNQGRRFHAGDGFLQRADLVNGDVFSAEVEQRIDRLATTASAPWLVIAGPPCQSFSTLGNRKGESDPRGNLTLKFFHLIAKYRPPLFLFENVPPLGQRPGSELREEIFKVLDRAGYTFHARLVNMADYGCFTKRKRFIILGSRIGDLPFPEPTHCETGSLFRPGWRTSADALSGIPDPYAPNSLTHHHPVYHTEEVSRRFKGLRPGEYDRKRHRSKLDPLAPGPTLVAGATGGYCHHIHWASRELTSRESARLHGFSDSFDFMGSKLDVAKQIANSIPVDFGRTMGTYIFRALSGFAQEVGDAAHVA